MTKKYIPQRNDMVWLDFEPTKGKEIGKYRPAFVLSSEEYNKKTGLLICCPISTSVRGAKAEVPVANIDNKKSVVAASLIQTLSWKERKIKFITQAEPHVMNDVLYRIIPLIGGSKFFDS